MFLVLLNCNFVCSFRLGVGHCWFSKLAFCGETSVSTSAVGWSAARFVSWRN